MLDFGDNGAVGVVFFQLPDLDFGWLVVGCACLGGGGGWFVLTFSGNKFLHARPNIENYYLAYFPESNKKTKNIFLYVK